MRNNIIITLSSFFVIVGASSCTKNSIEPDEYPSRELSELLQLPGLPFHQSMAICGDLATFILTSNNKLYAFIYYLPKRYLCAKVELKTQGYKLPHANVACFGKYKYSEDSLFPLLYISQWSWSGDRGVLVFDIKSNYTAELVQFISPVRIDKDIIGYGDIDWIVDIDSNVLYALAYKRAGASTIVEDNEEIITSFRLPKMNQKTVMLEEDDIVDSYRCKILNYSQDKAYKDGKIYIIAGGNDSSISYMNKIYVMDLARRQLLQEYDISKYALGVSEPEGLCFYNDKLIMTYAKKPYILWECNVAY